MIETLITWALNNPELAGALTTGLGGSLAHWRKTGKLPIGRLPLRALKKATNDLRAQYFTKPRPKGVPAVVADAEPADVAHLLRERHFEGRPTSYKYSGEHMNLRRPHGTAPHPQTGDPVPLELHTRGFATDDGKTLLVTHVEASAYEAPQLHMDGSLTTYDDGRDAIRRVLSPTDLDLRSIDSERAADIDVV